HHAAADDQRARADRDVGHQVEHDAAVLPLDAPVEDQLAHDRGVEAELAADLLEPVPEAADDGLGHLRDAGGGGHQSFCGTSAKYSDVMMKLAKNTRMNVMTTAWFTASPTPFGPPLAYRPL